MIEFLNRKALNKLGITSDISKFSNFKLESFLIIEDEFQQQQAKKQKEADRKNKLKGRKKR